MGAWADIDTSTSGVVEAIQGLAEELLTDRGSQSFDAGQMTTKRINAAKGVVRRKVLTSSLAQEVDRYDGPEAMLDALAEEAKLEDMVHEAIAYAFLHVHSDSNRVEAGGVFDEQGSDFEDDVAEQVKALANTAPYVLDWSSKSGRPSGGALSSTMGRH